MKSRILSNEEKRVVIDALRRAAAETRRVRLEAAAGARVMTLSTLEKHTKILDLLSSQQDKLAAEMDAAYTDIRIDRK